MGIGFDAHRLVDGRPLVIAGVEIPFSKGLEGDSDGDVLVHAIIDAMLGATAMGDIGTYFQFDHTKIKKGVFSGLLLKETLEIVGTEGFKIVNIDSTIIAELPVLKGHIPNMRRSLAEILGLPIGLISIKATTTDGMGFTGKGEGIAAQAVVGLERAAE